MGFSGAIMPGPLLTVTINESLRRGASVGPQIATGHALLELVLVVAIFFGLGTVINGESVKGAIGVIGGLFLFWMAYGILKEAFSSIILDLRGQDTGKHLPAYQFRFHLVLARFSCSSSWPKTFYPHCVPNDFRSLWFVLGRDGLLFCLFWDWIFLECKHFHTFFKS